MSKKIDLYFTGLSPFTYLGYDTLLRIAQQTNAAIFYRPVKLARVFANSGALPIPQRPQCRLDYRLVELTRWAKKRNVPLTLHPAYFPADPTLADKCVIALQQSGQDVRKFVGHILAACWVEEKNIADEVTIRELVAKMNVNVDEVIALAKSDIIEAIYETNTVAAIDQGILGVPAYIYQGEQFWGQDRLELLSDALQ